MKLLVVVYIRDVLLLQVFAFWCYCIARANVRQILEYFEVSYCFKPCNTALESCHVPL
jgi:hypothetical protein